MSNSLQVINEKICNTPSAHEKILPVYQHGKASYDYQDDALLARLRSGHHPLLLQFLYRPANDSLCSSCHLTSKIWYTGYATVQQETSLGHECFGATKGPLSCLPVDLEIS